YDRDIGLLRLGDDGLAGGGVDGVDGQHVDAAADHRVDALGLRGLVVLAVDHQVLHTAELINVVVNAVADVADEVVGIVENRNAQVGLHAAVRRGIGGFRSVF